MFSRTLNKIKLVIVIILEGKLFKMNLNVIDDIGLSSGTSLSRQQFSTYYRAQGVEDNGEETAGLT